MTKNYPFHRLVLVVLLVSMVISYALPALVNAQMGSVLMRTIALEHHNAAMADSHITGMNTTIERTPHGDYLSSLPCLFCSEDKTTDTPAACVSTTESGTECQ